MATILQNGQRDGCEAGNLAPVRFEGVHRERTLNKSAGGAESLPRPCSTLAFNPKRIDHEQCAGKPFDAAAWFAEWSDNGGIVATIGDRLWIGRTPCLDRSAAKRLDALRGGIMHPDAATALRRVLRGNQVEVEA